MEQFLTAGRHKTCKKSLGAKIEPKVVFCHFFKFGSLVFLDIGQDCSLGQRLTSNRAKTSKKKKRKKNVAQIGVEMIFSI